MTLRSGLRSIVAALAIAVSWVAAQPFTTPAMTAEQREAAERAALKCITDRYEGAALTLAWVEPEGPHERRERGVYSVRWLTPNGSVLAIRISEEGCRFLLIEGIGQVEARKLP